MVDSDARIISLSLEFSPGEWSFINIQTPDIVNWLSTGITTENEEIRLREDDSVAVPAFRSLANHRYYHPLGSLVSIPQVEQVQII